MKNQMIWYLAIFLVFALLVTTISSEEDTSACAGCNGCCCTCCGSEADGDGDNTCGQEDADNNAGTPPTEEDGECESDSGCGSGCDEGYKCQGTGASAVCVQASSQEVCQDSDTVDEDCRSGPGAGFNRRGTDNSCDDDNDGYLDSTFSGGGVDCDDTRDDVNPNEPELCDNIDHDCDGDVRTLASVQIACTDDSCKCPKQNGVCAGSVRTCLAPVFVSATNSYWSTCGDDTYSSHNIYYERQEVTCNDGLDNDCDGLIDSADTQCEVEIIEIA